MNLDLNFAPLSLLAAGCLGVLTAGCGAPSPTLVGRIDAALLAEPSGFDALGGDRRAEILINGYPNTIYVDDDGAFATDGLPTGTVEISIAGQDVSATLVVEEVAPGELLEIDVRSRGRDLSIRLVRRQPAASDWMGGGETVRISGHHQVVHLPAGTISEDIIIDGHHITLVGAGNGDCAGWDRSVVTGDLLIRGHHVDLVNVSVEGRFEVDGHHVRYVRRCGGDPWKKFHRHDR